MTNSVDPDAVCYGSRLFASIFNLSVMLGNYLQQTTFSDAFFGNDVFSKHLFPMVSYTQNTHKIPISSNPRSTLLPSPLPIPLQSV